MKSNKGTLRGITEIEETLLLSVQHYAGSATVGLGPLEGPMDIGHAPFASGVLIKKGSRVFIATVAHYEEQVSLDKMTVVFAPKETVTVKDIEHARSLAKGTNWEQKTSSALKIGAKWHKCGTKLEDVMLVEIDPSIIPEHCWVVDIDVAPEKQCMPNPGETLLLSGLKAKDYVTSLREKPLPGQLPKQNFGRMLSIRKSQTIHVERPAAWINDDHEQAFFPEYHFALSYHTPDKEAPRGISGGGVWRPHHVKNEAGVLVPSPLLIGIENNYKRDLDCVKVTSIQRALALLES